MHFSRLSISYLDEDFSLEEQSLEMNVVSAEDRNNQSLIPAESVCKVGVFSKTIRISGGLLCLPEDVTEAVKKGELCCRTS